MPLDVIHLVHQDGDIFSVWIKYVDPIVELESLCRLAFQFSVLRLSCTTLYRSYLKMFGRMLFARSTATQLCETFIFITTTPTRHPFSFPPPFFFFFFFLGGGVVTEF